jgi:predicted thioesterase
MKSSLQVGLAATTRHTVDEARCIGFMGKEGMVYATPRMVLDVEHACRNLLLPHLDEGEDSVGTHVSIDHLAGTPLGFEVAIEVRIAEVDRRRVTFEFSVRDSVEECGRGKHTRFVADKHKSFERIQAKRAKAGM